KSLSRDERLEMVREQAVICRFARDEALAGLPDLLRDNDERKVVRDALALAFGDEAHVATELHAESKRLRKRLDTGANKPATIREVKAGGSKTAAG
ncbi:hypothetical protein, partial [Paracoccus sp. (in: a-proteobacteria)]|uniref:hypothetical protein n=1 Tax=Paracoccus sp. TaxID=267 RepID=UPI003A839F44